MRIFITLIILGLFSSCDPTCDSLVYLSLDGDAFQHDQEILIRSNPTHYLEDKQIIFSSRSSGEQKRVSTASSTFIPGVGIIVNVPQLSGSDIEVFIDDADCGLINLNRSIILGDESFFTDNPDFIVPNTMHVTIPISAPIIPPLVRNAWFHPENSEYCLWLRFVLDENDEETRTLCPASSAELSINCDNDEDLYHGNPVYGIIDKENNYINIWIDRNVDGKGLGVEEFEGQFINIDDTPYAGDGEPCGGNWVPGRKHMMYIVSKTTGRHMVLYQQPTPADVMGNGLSLVSFEAEAQCRVNP